MKPNLKKKTRGKFKYENALSRYHALNSITGNANITKNTENNLKEKMNEGHKTLFVSSISLNIPMMPLHMGSISYPSSKFRSPPYCTFFVGLTALIDQNSFFYLPCFPVFSFSTNTFLLQLQSGSCFCSPGVLIKTISFHFASNILFMLVYSKTCEKYYKYFDEILTL